jgi:hypothetical protein
VPYTAAALRRTSAPHLPVGDLDDLGAHLEHLGVLQGLQQRGLRRPCHLRVLHPAAGCSVQLSR